MPFPVSVRHANAVLHIGLFRRDANGVFVPVAIGHARAPDPGGVGRATRQHRFEGRDHGHRLAQDCGGGGESVRSDRGASPDPRRRATGAELHPDRNRAGYRFVAPVTRVEAAPRNGQRGPGNFGKLGVEFCSHSVTFAVQGRNATAGGRAHAGCRSPRNGVTAQPSTKSRAPWVGSGTRCAASSPEL
jgi:hypothetical protein